MIQAWMNNRIYAIAKEQRQGSKNIFWKTQQLYLFISSENTCLCNEKGIRLPVYLTYVVRSGLYFIIHNLLTIGLTDLLLSLMTFKNINMCKLCAWPVLWMSLESWLSCLDTVFITFLIPNIYPWFAITSRTLIRDVGNIIKLSTISCLETSTQTER